MREIKHTSIAGTRSTEPATTRYKVLPGYQVLKFKKQEKYSTVLYDVYIISII